MVRRSTLLLLACFLVAAMQMVEAAEKRCKDKDKTKKCRRKQGKSYCNEEANCPSKKKNGKKCRKQRKRCQLTCGLCVKRGEDLPDGELSNGGTNTQFDSTHTNTQLTDHLTKCGCVNDEIETNSGGGTWNQKYYVHGWDTSTTVSPPYFCVKTVQKGGGGNTHAYHQDPTQYKKICYAPTSGMSINQPVCDSNTLPCGRGEC